MALAAMQAVICQRVWCYSDLQGDQGGRRATGANTAWNSKQRAMIAGDKLMLQRRLISSLLTVYNLLPPHQCHLPSCRRLEVGKHLHRASVCLPGTLPAPWVMPHDSWECGAQPLLYAGLHVPTLDIQEPGTSMGASASSALSLVRNSRSPVKSRLCSTASSELHAGDSAERINAMAGNELV